MPGAEPATAAAYRGVLHRHGFTADADPPRFHHPANRAIVTVTDAEPASVTIAAPADSTQRYRWEIDLHGAPVDVLDALLHAVAADLAVAPDGT